MGLERWLSGEQHVFPLPEDASSIPSIQIRQLGTTCNQRHRDILLLWAKYSRAHDCPPPPPQLKIKLKSKIYNCTVRRGHLEKNYFETEFYCSSGRPGTLNYVDQDGTQLTEIHPPLPREPHLAREKVMYLVKNRNKNNFVRLQRPS